MLLFAFVFFSGQIFGENTIHTTNAQSLPLPDIGNYGEMVQDPGTVTSFDTAFASLVVGFVMNIRYLITAIAIFLIVYSGFKVVISNEKEQSWTQAKSAMVWGIVGLALVGLSGEIVRIFAVGKCTELGMLPATNNIGCVEGGFLKDPHAIIQRTTLFNKSVQYIITFIKYVVGAVAVVMLMKNAIHMITNSGGEELNKDKKSLLAAAIGLLVIIIADPIVNKVLFNIDKTRYPGIGGAEVGIDYKQGISELVGFTNFIVSVLTPLVVLTVVIGGIMYMASGSNAENREKAKKMITLAMIGLIIIYGAFAIVSTFINGQFDAGAPNINPAASVEKGSVNPNYQINES